jgi:hypothetical protein
VRFWRNRNCMTFKHFFQAAYLVYHARNTNIAHLHAHFAHSPTSVAMFASEISGIPFSFTAHAKDIYTLSKKTACRKNRQSPIRRHLHQIQQRIS